MIRAVAHELLGHCPQGQTLPLYLRTTDGTVFQAKLPGRRSGMGPREMAIEVLGTRLSALLGLRVGVPAVVELPSAIRASVEERYAFGVSGDRAFGTVHMPDLEPFVTPIDAHEVPPRERATVLALDLAIANGDRTAANPNLGWLEDDLFVFDFEHGLTLPSGSRGWTSHLELLSLLRDDHVFRESVTDDQLAAAFFRLTSRLDLRSGWRRTDRLPEEWRLPYRAAADHLSRIIEERHHFLRAAVERA